MASYSPDEGGTPSEGGDSRPELPSRPARSRPVHTEARAELRDRATYYTELRQAVEAQTRNVPAPRAALEDPQNRPTNPHTHGESRTNMNARYDDTWT